MTAALGGAILLGGGLAFFNSHAPQATPVRAEAAEPTPREELAEPVVKDSSAALSGTVLETLAASKYTYLRLSTASDGQVWAAVPSSSVAVGTRVSIAGAARMVDFKSDTLKRTFKEIYFGTLAANAPTTDAHPFSPADVLDDDEQELPEGHPAVGASAPLGPVNDSDPLPPGHPDLNSGAPHGAASPANSAVAELPTAPIAKARGQNAHVIAELDTVRHALAGQRIRVRGQVSKVTPNVQGHTFFHLRDGSSLRPGQVTDLIVTSSLEPSPGQIATFEGTLRADVDVGIGYAYPVLLENATLVAE